MPVVCSRHNVCMGLRELLDVLRIGRVHVASRTIFVDAVSSGRPGCCPVCGNSPSYKGLPSGQ